MASNDFGSRNAMGSKNAVSQTLGKQGVAQQSERHTVSISKERQRSERVTVSTGESEGERSDSTDDVQIDCRGECEAEQEE